MQFKKSAPTVLIAAVVLAFVAISAISINLTSKFADAVEDSEYQAMRAIWNFNLKGGESKALARADMIASMPSVRKAFAAQDRAQLLAETQDMFKNQTNKFGVAQSQFHVLPHHSFLRLNAPDKFGDDLSSFRPIVMDVLRNRQAKQGITVSRSGPGIFGVTPVLNDKGEFLGSFEMGIDFSGVLDGLKAAYGFEMAMFIDGKLLTEVATGLGGDVLNKSNQMGQYIRFHSTHAALLGDLVGEENINITEESRYVREANGLPYGVLLLPVFNYTSKQIGVVAIAKDFSATRAAQGQLVVWQCLAALIFVVLLAGLTIIVINGSLVSPIQSLTESIETHLQEGKGLNLEFEGYCKEFQDVAEACRKLCAGHTPPHTASTARGITLKPAGVDQAS